MKALYLSPVGRKIELPDRSKVENHIVIDMDPIRRTIVDSIRKNIDSIELIEAAEAFPSAFAINQSVIKSYDMLLCDLTTGNGNILYLAGIAEALHKPVIYILNGDSPLPNVLTEKRVLNYSSHALSNEFLAELFESINIAAKNPKSLLTAEARTRTSSAFISYSHRDKSYLDRLMVHLKPMERRGHLDVWVDTRIISGEKWRESIQGALDRASIAILLVSADFLASDFIVDNELPPLLSRAEVNGTKIIPVVLSPCRFSRDHALNRFQSVNDPTQPLSSMSHDERESIYDRLVQDIERAIPSAHSDKSAQPTA